VNIRKVTAALWATVVASGLVAASATPAVATQELIEATPATTTIVAPAPGHSQDWQVDVRNTTTQTLPVVLTIEGDSAQLFGGSHPIHVEIVDDSGEVVVSGAAPSVLGATVELDALGAHEERRYTARVALPRSAGNEYQGASGTLDLSFVASAEATTPETGPSPDDALAHTGGSGTTLALIAATALGMLTLGAVLAARRRKEHA